MTTDRENLLQAVLQDEDYAAFRETLLQTALGQVRQRRRLHQCRQVLVLLGSLGLAATLFWLDHRSTPLPTAEKPSWAVRTSPLSQGQLVRTLSADSLPAETRAGIGFVRTDPAEASFESVSDDQLLAALKDRSLALVQVGPARKELWFLDGGDVQPTTELP